GEILSKDFLMKSLVNKVDETGIIELESYHKSIGISLDDLTKDLQSFLKPNQHVVGDNAIIVSSSWLGDLKKKTSSIGVIELVSVSRELGISVSAFEILLATYINGTFDAHRKTFVVGSGRIEHIPSLRKDKFEIHALRGGEFVGNRFRYKVKVTNDSTFVVTDVTVTLLTYPRDTLSLEGDSTKNIAKIDPGGFRSPTFDFLPTQDCVKGDIIASISYIDSRGHAHSMTTEPFTIRAVCDLLRPETVTVEEFMNKLSTIDHGEMASRVEDWTPEEMHDKTLQILRESNFFEVSSEIDQINGNIQCKTQGWAKGIYTGKNLGVEITISGIPSVKGATCKVRMYGEDEAMIMPAIDEISQKLVAWLCPKCGGALPQDSVEELKTGMSVACPFCGITIGR
ncbi:MAG: hypothetical protein ACTSQZ_07765, partial [Candidatus Thorarchaeota archaeon]